MAPRTHSLVRACWLCTFSRSYASVYSVSSSLQVAEATVQSTYALALAPSGKYLALLQNALHPEDGQPTQQVLSSRL